MEFCVLLVSGVEVWPNDGSYSRGGFPSSTLTPNCIPIPADEPSRTRSPVCRQPTSESSNALSPSRLPSPQQPTSPAATVCLVCPCLARRRSSLSPRPLSFAPVAPLGRLPSIELTSNGHERCQLASPLTLCSNRLPVRRVRNRSLSVRLSFGPSCSKRTSGCHHSARPNQPAVSWSHIRLISCTDLVLCECCDHAVVRARGEPLGRWVAVSGSCDSDELADPAELTASAFTVEWALLCEPETGPRTSGLTRVKQMSC